MNTKMWAIRKYSQVDFYITQFLNGHECFQAYFDCPHCPDYEECIEHLAYYWPHFNDERRELIEKLQQASTLESTIKTILSCSIKLKCGERFLLGDHDEVTDSLLTEEVHIICRHYIKK